MNTFNKGQVKILVYRDKVEGTWYGSALELNLTVDGEDKNTVLLELDRAMKDYIQSASELAAIELLNQEPDPELVALWTAHFKDSPSPVESPYTSHMAGSETFVRA